MQTISRALLAVLAGCAASAAMAQSSVSLYGQINTSIEQQKLGHQKTSGLMSNGSFLGLRAQEDLGAGLRAGMVLEADLNADNGSGADSWGDDGSFNFGRRSEVNLSGGFGMLRLGSFKPASYEATAQAIHWLSDDHSSTSDAFFASKYSRGDVLAYRTPSWAGLTAELQYRFGEKRVIWDDMKFQHAVDLGVNYVRGPWGMGFGYSENKSKDSSFGDTLKDNNYTLRGSYDTGTWALGAYYQRQETRDNWVDISRDDVRRNVFRLAGKYAWGASEFHANIGRSNTTSTSREVGGPTAQYRNNITQWSVAYHYKLSQRTKVYAFYSHMDDGFPSKSFPALWGSSGNFRSVGLGVRHQF